MMRTICMALAGLAAAASGAARGDGPAPRAVPLTRPEMKQLIEDMKNRHPRLPLPELTEADKEKLGDRGTGYESRLRYHYMPWGMNRSGGTSRQQDGDAWLVTPLRTQLFWIVSRANNCQYCLGHQEGGLLRSGQSDDQIAALDGDWSEFTPAEQAAFSLARRMTLQPHLLGDADIERMLAHYTPMQTLEIVMSISRNNSTNRWKEGPGIPQNAGGGGGGRSSQAAAEAPAAPRGPHSYVTPTSEKYQTKLTQVAPLVFDAQTGEATRQTQCNRPAIDSPADIEQGLSGARGRTPRLPLVDEAKAREAVGAAWTRSGPLPQWLRLLANFPREAASRAATYVSDDEQGDLSPLLKAQASWVIAVQDRAWYAAGEAQARLQALGATDEQIQALGGSWASLPAGDRALLAVAKKLAASPVVLTDDDVELAVKLKGPRDVLQMISYTTGRAYFDRLTEAAGLPLEN